MHYYYTSVLSCPWKDLNVNDQTSGGSTSRLDGADIPVDQQNGESEMNPVKNEEHKDDCYLCKATL